MLPRSGTARAGTEEGRSGPSRLAALVCALLLLTVGACNANPEAPKRSASPDVQATREAPGTTRGASPTAAETAGVLTPVTQTPRASTASPGEVGPAGGTVDGPDGARVVIPAGALAADTTIAIERTSRGAAPLPVTMTPIGQIYAFTPHGTTFTQPVTVTVPYDPASVPAGFTPGLYKTNAQGAWEALSGVTAGADMVSAQVTSFSNLNPGVERRAPQREWVFTAVKLGDPDAVGEVIRGDDHDSAPWLEVHPREAFDSTSIDLDRDDVSVLEVFSSADGVTFWAHADDVGDAQLTQTQGFYKRSSDATLKFVITGATMEIADLNQAPSQVECPLALECRPLFADVGFQAVAYDRDWDVIRDRNGGLALDAGGFAALSGLRDLWDFDTPATGFAQQVWSKSDFDFVKDHLESVGQDKSARAPQAPDRARRRPLDCPCR